MKKNKLFRVKIHTLIVLLIIFVLTPGLASIARATQFVILQPSVFDIRATDVTVFDGLEVEKIVGGNYKIKGLSDEMEVTFRAQVQYSNFDGPYPDSRVSVKTGSNMIWLCNYQRECGSSLTFQSQARDLFYVSINKKLTEAEQTLVDLYEGRIEKVAARDAIARTGFSNLIQYVENRVKGSQPVGDFHVEATIDQKRLNIDGAIVYEPRNLTAKTDKIISWLLSIIIFFALPIITLYLMFRFRHKMWVLLITATILIIYSYIILLILRLYS